MRIKVIGSSGSELPGNNLSAFLVDDFLLMDAGTIGLVLGSEAQKKISHILITHAHLDHINGIPFLVDNMVIRGFRKEVAIISGRDVLRVIRNNIFNNRIWPDFSAIPDKKKPALKYQEITTTGCIRIKDYRIYATRVNHSVAAYGYIIEDAKGNAVVYTGDTGPTDKLWKKMSRHNVKVIIAEVSFPSSMGRHAIKTGHLTPALLKVELGKMARIPEKVYISHIKQQYREIIKRELKMLKIPSVELLENSTVISL